MSRRFAERGGGGKLGLGRERGAGRTQGVNSSTLGTASLVKEQVERRGWGTGKYTSFSRSSAAHSLQEQGGVLRVQTAVISVDMSNICQPLHLCCLLSSPKRSPLGMDVPATH